MPPLRHRLVWNFEVDTTPTVVPSVVTPSALQWEIRFFWTDETIIPLAGLGAELLMLAQFHFKQKTDHYYLHPNATCNLKKRRDVVYHKPLLAQYGLFCGYGKKVKINTQKQWVELCGDSPPQALKTITVDKTTLKWRWQENLRLELARLQIQEQCFFSACLESSDLTSLQILSEPLLAQHHAMTYAQFLHEVCS